MYAFLLVFVFLVFELPTNLVTHAEGFSLMVSVSLKAKLSPSELSALIMDVRRRVEMDDTRSKQGAKQVI